MEQLQTVDEMRKAYDGEWVAIVDCEYDASGNLVRGRVAVHSPQRSDVHKQLPRDTGGAIEFFGSVPEDLHYAL